MIHKKPMVKESVGSQYYAFNKPDEKGNFQLGEYDEVVKTDTVKKIGTTENGENQVIRSSGTDYETVAGGDNVELSVETVAFDDDDLSEMRGEIIEDCGLILTPISPKKPFFAYGKVVKLLGGEFRLDWYPKCQLVSNTDDIETRGESFSEQNDTVTIKAYCFDGKNVKVAVHSRSGKFPEGMTEEKFFNKVIYSKETLLAALNAESVESQQLEDNEV